MKLERFRTKSIKEQLNELRKVVQGFGAICPQQYRRFLHKSKLAKYSQVEKLAIKDKAEEDRQYANLVTKMLIELLETEETVVYFDTTTIVDWSFRQNAWVLTGEQNQVKTGYQIRTIKVYGAISNQGIEGLWFHQELDANLIATFLKVVAARLMKKGVRLPIVFFLDNNKAHKAFQVQQITTERDVVLLFNAKGYPKLNLIEHFFEHLKRPLRQSFNMCPYESVSSMLFQAKKFSRFELFECLRRQRQGLAEVLSIS